MTEVERTAFRARRAAQTRGYRAKKKAESEPKPPRIVSSKNIRRNAMRKAQRAGDVFQSEQAKLQQRAVRARHRLKKVEAAGDAQRIEEAELALKIARVERWEFAVEHGNSVKIVPSKEDRRMYQPFICGALSQKYYFAKKRVFAVTVQLRVQARVE
ncbi:hypothetical protein AFLA70_594g000481 [Aspergillus flavus AF70]|nr:hypothetical protein AFLA70_594g000481 [Aspergillus flavus AF70]